MAEDPRASLRTGQMLGQALSLTQRYFGSVSEYQHGLGISVPAHL